MASSKSMQERIRELVAEMLAEEEQGAGRNINDIEDAMVRIGDQVAQEFGVQALAQHTRHAPEHPPCPDCGHAGEHAGPHTRELITRRGQVPLTEAKYRCPKCRRHFFPSDHGAGT
jgi:transposase-like protein